jgi:hypothetical protein
MSQSQDMKGWPFYLAAIALHLLVLFGIKAPAAQPFAAKEEKKYVEVTLEAGLSPGEASPEPTSAPPLPGPAASPPVTVSPLVPPAPEPPLPPSPVVEPPPPAPAADFADVTVPPPPVAVASAQEGPVAQMASSTPAPEGPLAAPGGKSGPATAAGAAGGTRSGNFVQWSVGEGGNGHYYEAVCVPEGINWMDAEKYAVTHSGYLATIHSAAENEFVFNLVKDLRFWRPGGSADRYSLGPWLGGFRSSKSTQIDQGWQWVNHEGLFTYTNWAPPHPDDNGRVGNRLQFFSWRSNDPQPTWNGYEIAQKVSGFVVEYDRDPAELPYNPNASVSLVDMYILPQKPPTMLTRH